MWKRFHAAITTDKFRSAWETLMLQVTHRIATLIFYQYITKVIFQEILKQTFTTQPPMYTTTNNLDLDYIECNAL